MNKKIKILFVNQDQAGVFYWRTYLPAIMLQQNHSDEFDVTIKQDFTQTTFEELAQYDIIHFHQSLHGENEQMKKFFDSLGIVSIIDIDDNPCLPPTHPMYHLIKTQKRDVQILGGLKYADAISTTTDYFAKFLRTYNKNVGVFNNAATTEITPQFAYNRKESDKIRVGYIGGASHGKDFEQLKFMFQLFSDDEKLQSKITTSLHGFDLRGSKKMSQINEELLKELIGRGIQLPIVFQEFNKALGDINKVKSIPNDLKEKYKNNFVSFIEQPLPIEENIWYYYESVFTDKYKLIKDNNYLNHLKKYVDEEYTNSATQPYVRHFTKNVNSYMKHYDHIDVSLIPLTDNEFNRCKSPLKLAEASLKQVLPIVSNNPIYTKYIKHGVNGFIAKDERDFGKILKKIVNEPQLITDLTKQFVEDVKDEFDLAKITARRVEWYKDLLNNKRK
jgi:glycosyltransferase involved in cell wall biosynthesis